MSYLKKIIRTILKNPFHILHFLICKFRSILLTRLIDEGGGKIIITAPLLSVKIIKARGSKLILKGDLSFIPHINGNSAVRINLSNNSVLQIGGDFTIGHGVKIFLNENSSLNFGGKKFESASGITSDTMIMVYKKIEVGTDFICAWNVFISDSDWHQIENQVHHKDVFIGDHVWIANNCSILKGSRIGNNSIVASHSKVSNSFPPDSLLAGIPAKRIKSNISWSREIIA